MQCNKTSQNGPRGATYRVVRWGVAVAAFYLVPWLLNWLSYTVLKNKVLRRQRWDLNVCCGKTDGGGVNVDIVRHAEVPNLVLVDDIYRLPFGDKQFGTVLCSHTMEHVARPAEFYRELKRVGREVTLLVPPLWDLSAAFNFLEHKSIFFSLETEHRELPRYVPMPFVSLFHRWFGQRIKA